LIPLVVIFFHFFSFLQEQVTACWLDARNVPSLPGIPPIEHDKVWVIVEELCVRIIDEVKCAEDAHTHYHTDDGTSDFMSTAAAARTTLIHQCKGLFDVIDLHSRREMK